MHKVLYCVADSSTDTSREKMMGTCDKNTTFEILDRYKSLGGNFIDLANNYQAGQSETWVGEWLAERNCRG
jgi:aryl-alcohol dehydrogenase-like predicted oxidoreductase